MKHRLMQVLSLVLALVLLFGCIPTAFAETPEIPVETEPPYTGAETDTGQVPPVTEETTPPTEPETAEPPAETTAPPQTEEPPVTEAPTEVTEPPEQEAPPTTEQDFELDIGDVLVPTTVGDSQIAPMTLPPDTDLTIVKKDYYTPFPNRVTFYFYSDNQPYPLGRYTAASATIFHLSDGRVGYCMHPMLSGGGDYEATDPGDSYIGEDGWPTAIYSSSSGWLSWDFDRISKQGTWRVMAYGAPNNGDTSDAAIKATALCVWDMITGHRNLDGTPRNGGAPFYDALTDSAIKAKYDELLDKLAQHGKTPSFTVRYRNELSSSSTITLKKDANTGLYTGSATDKNGVLANFHFTSNISGLTFTRSGNTLKVTATEAAAKKLNQLVVQSRGYELGEGTKACTVYQDKYNPGTKQKLIALDGPVDPVPCLFRLAVEVEGQIQVKKTTNTGQNLSGWKFEILDKATNKVVKTVTTDSKGLATATNLPAGEYIVREVGGGDAYWQLDTSGHTVTVVAGQTATVTVNNVHRGRIVVQKNAINGSAEGWNFEIWQGDAWIETITTGPDGTATSGKLLPGNYTVREFHDQWMDRYWEYDVNVEQNATVVAGQDTNLTYTNIQYGRIVVKKNAINGSAEGWNFEIWQGDAWIETITTGPDGTATSGKLLPGNYTVREFHDQWMDRYWEYDVNVEQNATVVAGQDTNLTYTNIQYGRIVVKKNAINGSAEGWNFEIWQGDAWIETITTGPDGTATSGKLLPGNYTVREFHDQWMDHYWEYDVNVEQNATVTAGQDTNLTYTNIQYGRIQIQKTTNTGQNLSGWKFEIVNKTTGKVVQTVTTDASGYATTDKLEPGSYIVREVGGGDAYWQLDTSGHTVTVVAGQTATVTVNNVHRGRIVVQKNAVNGSPEGWKFEIWQGDTLVETLTTGADGRAVSKYLLPGNYKVKELHDRDGTYWEYDVNVEQNATVTAGHDTTVTYTNTQYGRIQIQKTTNTGQNLSGWKFEIVNKTTGKVVQTVTTDASGYATTDKLEPGSYIVREVGGGDAYWQLDTSGHTVTVVAGQTATVTVNNVHRGRIVVQKNAVNGSPEGWKFEIWQGDTLVETLTTGADGRAVSKYLLPGNYKVKELHDRDGTYWEYDVNVEQNVTVTAGQDTNLTYTNTQYGRLQIVKTMADGTSPAGWVFRVTDSTGQEIPGSPFTTGEDGVILSGKLAPGTYTVEEIIPEDSLYFCDSPNPQTVVVTAGATASVSFTNALRPGKINIQKVDTLGNPLSGAVFLLEWSTDGKIWNPIVYSESIQAGGCSNPDVVDGCITTGEDGLASWENLHPGLYYRVTEVKAPNGYQLLTEPVFTGKLPIEDLTISLRVVNAPIFTLPQTGGMGFDGFTAGIILSLSACLGALFFMLSAGKKPRLFSYQKRERKGFKMKKFFALVLAMMLLLSSIPTALAADAADATIDTDASCSLTIFKYDWTNAVKDGVWNEDSFISTGWRESYVEDVLGNAVRQGDADGSTGSSLGNGQNSNGYALKGVEFTTLKVADIVTFTESANDQHPDYNLTQVLYGFHKVKAADLLAAIGLADGAGRYTNADNTDKLSPDNYYYTSETLNKALAAALAANATTVKDALETYMASQDGAIVMAKTDENGKTIQRNLPVGLYLCVETAVPEMVTSTTNPFFVSLPMTTVSGDENSASPEGGHAWNYDVVVYPKNETGIPTLEKTVREAKKDTGKNEGTSTITDGFAHTATGSSGDVMEYQVISTLPTITSQATALTVYNFYDTLCEGLSYNKSLRDVKIEFFTDKDCTDKVASWDMDSGKFTVTYSSDDRHMTVDVTAAGLAEINGDTENVNGQLYAGYSNYTIRVTYTATIDSDASVVFGDNGNDNQVVLTWKRTSTEYYDTLIDDCHVFTFGIDLTKLFSDVDSETAEDQGMFDHVKFKIWNETDGYWVTATRNDEEGVYYVTGHVTDETDATIFHPVTMGEALGQIMVKGCEDDEYIITEVETANGYTLLKDDIHVVISTQIDNSRPCDIYTQDVLGVLQNDPHYSFDGNLNLHLANIPQKQLAHDYLTASATVDGNAVTMLEDNGSANAEAPLTVVNTPGFDLPQTGGYGTTIFTVTGIVVMALAAGVTLWLLFGKRKKENA